MINYTTASTAADLQGILQLQKQNLPSALSPDEISGQGFVTVVHSFDELNKLNEIEHHVIAKDGDNVIAYLLAMTEDSQSAIPVLVPMFEAFNNIPFAGRSVSDFAYIVVGQVCVGKRYRGLGVLDNCYRFYKETFQKKYAFAITEIDARNLRSLKAHKRIGFGEVFRYATNEVEWVIVLWDWNNLAVDTETV